VLGSGLPSHLAYYERFVPLGRHGRPEDLASQVLFLGSDQAQWITGTVIPVDGGLTAN
jgi:NAD(P)-dependent dehydrogenase (short-subunit alcohol dehydrogenase family)